MSQFHLGEGVKATLDFNGTIDGEPTVTSVGVGTMTQDPKIENTLADGSVETTVVLHFRNPIGGTVGFCAITGSALADNPTTSELETVLIDFPEVCEYIPLAQAKATSVTIATEVEPV